MTDALDTKDTLRAELRSAREEVYRARILDAAEAVFADAGFEGARVRAIARRTGLSVGSIYGVFPSKDAIFDAVHERRATDLFTWVAERTAGAGRPLDVVMAGVDATVRFFCAHPDYLRMHLMERNAWASALQPTRTQTDTWQRGLDLMASVLGEGIARGEIVDGDPRTHARMIMAMHQVALSDWLDRDPRPDPAEVVRSLSGLVKRAFAR